MFEKMMKNLENGVIELQKKYQEMRQKNKIWNKLNIVVEELR